MLGRMLLIALSASSIIGTVWADFDKHHLFNPQWPAHARFHAAAFALLNIGCGVIALVFAVFLPFGWARSLLISEILLGLMGLVLFASALVPGVSPVAGPHEKIWRALPLSLWIGMGYMALLMMAALIAAS